MIVYSYIYNTMLCVHCFILTRYLSVTIKKMRILIQCTLLILLIMQTWSLTCRSEHGPKDDEVKKIFNKCLKQEGNSNENTRQGTDNRGNNQRNQWAKDSESEEKESRMGNRNKSNKEKTKDQRANNGRIDSRQSGMSDNRGMDERYGTNDGKNNRMDKNSMDKINDRGGNDNTNNYGAIQHLRSQDEFLQSEEYGDVPQNSYYSSLNPPRRYKREKHTEMNSGQRSQYNPHSQRSNGNGNDHGQETHNSSNNSSKENDKACVLHCLMESLHMTSDSGMPDQYLVTHALTKDEKNEDLRDFLQESIEECFQILQNENTDDKCEFSKNLLTCLSEKCRANCDDWNGKPSFLF